MATSSMVRLIKRPPLCRGAKEERCQTPAPLRNEGSILLSEGVYVRHGTKYDRAPRKPELPTCLTLVRSLVVCSR